MSLSTVVSMSKLRDYYHLYHTDGDIQQIPQIHSLRSHGFVREGVPSWVPVPVALCFYISILANAVRECR